MSSPNPMTPAPILSAGWFVELLRCDHLDDAQDTERWFGVNLIAPQASTSTDWTIEDPVPDISSETALSTLADLLFPWKWDQPDRRKWKLFGRVDPTAPSWQEIGTYTVIAGTPEVHASSADLCKTFADEVAKRSSGCDGAFSVNDSRWLGHTNPDRNSKEAAVIEQSLVHALAPPTHAPVVLSNQVFGYAGFIKITKADFDPFKEFVAFPVVRLNNILYTPTSVAQNATGFPAASYDTVYGSVTLIFKSFATAADKTKLADLGLNISYGSPARDVIAPIFAAHDLPLGILGNAVGDIQYADKITDHGNEITNPDLPLFLMEKFPAAAWRFVLVQALGTGWFRRRPDGKRPHVLEYAASGADIDDWKNVLPSLDKLFIPPASPTDSDDWLKRLRKHYFDSNVDRSSPDAPLLDALDDVLADVADLPTGSPDDSARRIQAQRFFRSWSHLALEFIGDRRSGAFQAWLEVLIRLKAPQNPTPDENKAIERICARLDKLISANSSDRLLLGALDVDANQPPWTPLENMVDADEDPKKEGDAADALKQWCSDRIDAKLKAEKLDRPSQTDTRLGEAKGALLADFGDQGHRLVRREFDQGLPIRFDDMTTIGDVDKQIRGFAIALQTGLRDGADAFKPDRAAWITQTGVLSYAKDPGAFLTLTTDGTIAMSAGTVGSATQDGQRVVQFIYNGNPVFAAGIGTARNPTGALDADDFRSLDFRWPEGSVLPSLGYGCELRGVCTAIDNAGGVVNSDLRDSDRDKVACLVAIEKLDSAKWPTTPPLKYRSCVAPGAPKVESIGTMPATDRDVWELTDETRALRFASQSLKAAEALPNPDDRYAALRAVATGGALPRVACIAPVQKLDDMAGTLYARDCPQSLLITLTPPPTSKAFVRAWLATDQMAWRTKTMDFSDPNFGRVTESAFNTFVASVFDDCSESKAGSCYHPAVGALGITFHFGDRFPPLSVKIDLARTKIDAGKLRFKPELLHVKVSVDPARSQPAVVAQTIDDTALVLPAGCFVRMRCYALVANEFFTGDTSKHRFYESLPSEQFAAFPNYRCFGPCEAWVESLPLWKQTPNPGSSYFTLRIARPTATFPDRQQLVLTPVASMSAEWIRAVDINRHAWHWTGYPVRFPSLDNAADLASWLPAFAGVESNREQQRLELSTQVDRAIWRYTEPGTPDVILHEHRLRASERPSQYAAYTVRPRVRFAAWLNPKSIAGKGGPRDLENDIFAWGDVIEGLGAFGESERLPAPSFEYRIPLTATFMYDATESFSGLQLARSVNGNLLIFDDAIRRTDSFACSGGLGDTIEVDLLQTRHVPFKSKDRTFFQIGPNPIFHRSPVKDGALPPDFEKRTLKVSAPHGLTYDLVRNAKVAQTAILVQPAMLDANQEDGVSVEGAPTEWQLAQVRVRRLILPETQFNAALVRRGPAGKQFEFDLRWRREGVERIPGDFAVDLTRDGGTLKLTMKVDSIEYPLLLPSDVPTGEPVRLLVSFHKGRWDPQKPAEPMQGMPYWAPQVYVQRRQSASLGWVTIGRSTCHGRDPWPAGDGKLTLTVEGTTTPNARAVQMSDYTDARWLLFMGAIPGTGKQPPEEYLLIPYMKDGKLRLSLARGAFADMSGPPEKPEHWTDERTEFFMLFVSTPPSNIMAGRYDPRDRALLAFKPIGPDARGQPEFELLGESPKLDALIEATAVLCSFQRVSSPSFQERQESIDSLEKLVNAIFPDPVDGHPRESLVRPTGSHWGPMRISPPNT